MNPATWPPPVCPGDRVGVAALSSAVDPERLAAGVAELARLGFEVVLADNLGARHGPLAGTDDERLDGFHRLAADAELQAVFFARGGYGASRLLHRLDWSLLRRRPRAYIGYSDLTLFLNAIVERLGWVSFHGPMVAADLARGLCREERESLLDALAGRRPQTIPLEVDGIDREVEGVLAGGCLSLLAAGLGTPYQPRLEGSLLLLEDIGEPLYRIDRMLTQLKASGSLVGTRALLLGDLGTGAEEDLAEGWFVETLRAIGKPVAREVPCGHGAINLTIPLGCRARIDPAASRLILG